MKQRDVALIYLLSFGAFVEFDFLNVTFFACPKKVTKEKTPRGAAARSL